MVGGNNLKVTAHIEAVTPTVVIDVPSELCNLVDFMPYVKREIFNKLTYDIVEQYAEVKFELGDTTASNK